MKTHMAALTTHYDQTVNYIKVRVQDMHYYGFGMLRKFKSKIQNIDHKFQPTFAFSSS